MIKNLPASAGDTRDVGSVPASGKIPWTEEPGGPSVGLQRDGHDWAEEHIEHMVLKSKSGAGWSLSNILATYL